MTQLWTLLFLFVYLHLWFLKLATFSQFPVSSSDDTFFHLREPRKCTFSNFLFFLYPHHVRIPFVESYALICILNPTLYHEHNCLQPCLWLPFQRILPSSTSAIVSIRLQIVFNLFGKFSSRSLSGSNVNACMEYCWIVLGALTPNQAMHAMQYTYCTDWAVHMNDDNPEQSESFPTNKKDAEMYSHFYFPPGRRRIHS